MKILYIKLPDGYSDSWTYQENVLSTKFAQMGHETHLVVSPRGEDKDGNKIFHDPANYINSSGVHVHILPFTQRLYKLCRKFDYFDTLYELMNKIQPDFIFSHSVQYASLLTVAKYKKHHPAVKLVADNHADHVIMPVDNIRRKIVHKFIYKYFVKKADRYIDKYYGVSPSRGKYLTEIYGVNPNKIEIIPQVGDDTTAQKYNHVQERQALCEKYHLDSHKTILLFGAGTIDEKKNSMSLISAVEKNTDFELVIFGTFTPDVKATISKHLEQSNIHYIGNLDGETIYRTIIASDMAIYPGQHSVLWDNTVACGTPLCVKRWEGMDYFDINGNCKYIIDGTTEELVNLLDGLDSQTIEYMRSAALGIAKKKFSATEIAKRILEEK